MRRLGLFTTVALLALTGTAQGRFPAGQALRSAGRLTLHTVNCPAGMPIQTITVVNRARVSRLALARFENAMIVQSMQVRGAWGTPCVQFAPGGWYLYLEPNVTGFGGHWAPNYSGPQPFFPQAICARRPDPTRACAQIAVQRGRWTIDASHELVETLVDPSMQGQEVCDPVEQWAYRVRGVWVSDFVTPSGHAFR